MQVLQAARADDSELSSLIEVLPEEISSDSMEQQIQVALSCFSAGVSITSSLSIGGFDTHKIMMQHILLDYNRFSQRSPLLARSRTIGYCGSLVYSRRFGFCKNTTLQ